MLSRYYRLKLYSKILLRNCKITGLLQNKDLKKNIITQVQTVLVLSLKNLVIGINGLKKKKLNFKFQNSKVEKQMMYAVIQCNFNQVRKNFISRPGENFIVLNNASKLEKYYNEQIKHDYFRSLFLKKIYPFKKENKICSTKFFHGNYKSSLIGKLEKNFVGKKHFSNNKFQKYDKLIEYVNPFVYPNYDSFNSRPLSKIISNRISRL